jgi:uncharacterized protein YciI
LENKYCKLYSYSCNAFESFFTDSLQLSPNLLLFAKYHKKNHHSMNQYIVTGYDYTDEGALERRMAVRPHHLDGAKELKASGNYVVGGALLNDEGKMIGSVLIVQFETEEELQAWQQREPYITQKIWETVDVKPFKVANIG